MTLNDTRSTYLLSQLHDLQGYLSVPSATTGSACAYMLPGIDIGYNDGKANMGCSGVISQSCSQFLQERMQKPLEVISEQERCPQLPSKEDLRGSCGDRIANGWGISSRTARVLYLS